MTGAQAVSRYLDEQGIGYELVEHRDSFTAEAEAHAAGVSPHDTAKAVVLRDGDAYRLAVIPASAQLDLRKARSLFAAGESLRLASEEEIAAEFPSFELGALPPIGPLLPVPEALDASLLEHDRIMVSGGDRRHGVLIDPNDLVEVTQAKVADLRAR
jgi:Ala-tRNA(Pro) deacylase